MNEHPSQTEICQRFGSLVVPADESACLGVALSTLSQVPLNAMRHTNEEGISGWFIWGGELSQSRDFFQPLHVHHLVDHVPAIIPYLALAPGWRVLLAPGYEDVWYDPSLLAV